jgi:ribosomal S3-like protein
MGNIINPVSIRLAQNRTWKANWVSFSEKNNLSFDDFFLNNLINWYFTNNLFLKKLGLIFSHYYITKIKNKIEITFILNNSMIEFNYKKYIHLYFLRKKRKFFKRLFNKLSKKSEKYLKYNFIQKELSNESCWKYHEYLSFLSIISKKEKKLLKYDKNFKLLKYNISKKNYTAYFLVLYKYYFSKLIYHNFLTYVGLILKQNFLWYLLKSNIKNIKFKLNIYYIGQGNVNSSLVLKYLIIKLKQRFSLNELIYPLFRLLKKNKNIIGVKIGCFGRFSRKQRASKIWYSYGKLPLNTLVVPIDYSMSTVKLKNSICGIKVFMCYSFGIIKTVNEKNLFKIQKNNFLNISKLDFNTYNTIRTESLLNSFKKTIWDYYLKSFKN